MSVSDQEMIGEEPSRVYARGQQRKELRELVASKYRIGKTVRQIAEDIGKSYGATYNLLKESGVRFRDSGYRSDW